MATINNLKEARIIKLEQLRKLGINPYPAKCLRKNMIKEARELTGKEVVLAGRVMGIRGHGKILFNDLIDESGKIQLLFKSDILDKKSFSLLELIDIGDFLSIKGIVGKTQAGEITVTVSSFQIITKSVTPWPDKWHGLKDVEERYRKRYVDLMLNPQVKERIRIRGKVIQSIRELLIGKGYLEVETPTLQPIYGGGFARPFKTHHNALDADFFLRISDEMYLKRLIVGGFEKVFEITKVFRNEGIDHDHNPEFTMFEAQIAYEDYTYGMDIFEELVEFAAGKVLNKTELNYQGQDINLKRPWKRYKLVEAIKEFTKVDPLNWNTIDEARKGAVSAGISPEKKANLDKLTSIGEIIAFVFEEKVEDKLIQPTIIYDYPVEVSPLAKKCEDERFTQRFEVFVFGSELGNNYSELNDPLDLRKRFIEEKKREKAGFAEAHQTDYDYLEAIEHGFPPTCGLGMGVDRLVMLLTDASSIKEVIAFPTLKPLLEDKETPNQKINFIKKPEHFDIDPKVREIFPSVSVGVAKITGVKVQKSSRELEEEKKILLSKFTSLSTEELSTFPEILSYRKLYKTMGIDWHSRRPSPEALLRRVALKKGLYTVNTCVDAYNLVVMKYRVSVGAFDASNVSFPSLLKFAEASDKILLLGDEQPTTYTEKELAYYDKKGGYNIDFNYRDAQRTMVTEKTTDIWVNVDGIFEITPVMVERTLTESVELIIKHCGGKLEFKGVII